MVVCCGSNHNGHMVYVILYGNKNKTFHICAHCATNLINSKTSTNQLFSFRCDSFCVMTYIFVRQCLFYWRSNACQVELIFSRTTLFSALQTCFANLFFNLNFYKIFTWCNFNKLTFSDVFFWWNIHILMQLNLFLIYYWQQAAVKPVKAFHISYCIRKNALCLFHAIFLSILLYYLIFCGKI